jgi:2-dehydropantoate 2-reductase
MEIVVLGAGSLGSLLGGLLSTAHDVTLVGRDPHVSAVRESGLTLTGAVERTVRPDARTEPPAGADLAVVTVKSYDTPTAAAALADCSLDAAVSLQNGMGNEERLAAALSCPVLAGTCTYGALLEEPGTVRCTGIGDVVLGPRAGGRSTAGDRVGEAFRGGDIRTTVASDMPRRLWRKLAVNAGINATTALARVENGALVDGPAGETTREAARETARVADAQGVDLDPEAAAERTINVAETTAENVSSMHQDVRGERRTEVDAINGYVVDQAVQAVPINRTLASLLRAWERERGLR